MAQLLKTEWWSSFFFSAKCAKLGQIIINSEELTDSEKYEFLRLACSYDCSTQSIENQNMINGLMSVYHNMPKNKPMRCKDIVKLAMEKGISWGRHPDRPNIQSMTAVLYNLAYLGKVKLSEKQGNPITVRTRTCWDWKTKTEIPSRAKEITPTITLFTFV